MAESELAISKTNTAQDDLVAVRNLVKHFPIFGGVFRRVVDWVQAVDGVNFSIRRGETLGLVGESGCGKTTVGRTILRLLEPTSGTVKFHQINLFDLDRKQMKEMRRKYQLIFQDPYASLNPRRPIGDSIIEGLKIHHIGERHEHSEMMVDLLEKVGMEAYHANRFPHEFSGGQRQRIGIARALALQPEFIICDEPVSALDVSIQSQVLNLLKDLQDEYRLTYLFIAHNLSVIEHISDRVAVMYLGKIVELAPRSELFAYPLHYYTQALISAIPIPNPSIKRERIILKGEVPSPVNPPSGCRFHPRCPKATQICMNEEPSFDERRPNHWVSCWHAEV